MPAIAYPLANYSLPISEEHYLLDEMKASHRHEFLNGIVRAMADATVYHNQIIGNIRERIGPAARQKGCRALSENVRLRIVIPVGPFHYYPDILVNCGKPVSGERFLEDASLIIEVLSDSTEHTDRAEKFFMYQQLPSFIEYVMVSQDEMLVQVLRKSDGWKLHRFTQLTDLVPLESLGCEIALADIYPEP